MLSRARRQLAMGLSGSIRSQTRHVFLSTATPATLVSKPVPPALQPFPAEPPASPPEPPAPPLPPVPPEPAPPPVVALVALVLVPPDPELVLVPPAPALVLDPPALEV